MDASELNFERLPIEALHMTLITKEEMKSLSGEAKEAALQVSTRFFPIGLGKGSNKPNSNVFMMCVWPKAQMFRLKHGLAMKYFHITISRENDHTIVKGYDSLIDSALLISSLSMEANEALIRQLLLQKKNDLALIYATSLCENYGKETVRGWARLGEAAILNEKYKLAMLSYGHFYCISEHRAMKLLAIRKIIDCSSNTEWGRLFLESEIDEIPSELLPFLMKRWSATLKDEICKFITQSAPTQSFRFSLPSREKMYTALATSPLDPSYRLPRFFRWIVPFRLAAMSTPRNEEDIVHLKSSVGIDHIVTLTLEEPLPEQWFKDTNIKNTFMPVPNYAAPSMEQLDLFMELCLESGKNGSSVLVHCGGGKGRAGTIIACYLVAFGFNLPNVEDWQQPFMTANEAIDQLRSMRPGSIETIEQEQAVMKYCTRLWKRRSVLPKVIEEPPPSHPIKAIRY
jgi:atypical dual specificity phosphatase